MRSSHRKNSFVTFVDVAVALNATFPGIKERTVAELARTGIFPAPDACNGRGYAEETAKLVIETMSRFMTGNDVSMAVTEELR